VREKFRVRNLILSGLAIREAFSFWTGHPFDFEIWVRTGYWVARGVNPYGVLPSVSHLSFSSSVFSGSGTSTIAYLPLWPLLLAGLYNLYALIGFDNPLLYYFLLKQPSIIGDVLLGCAIFFFVRKWNPKDSEWAMKIWLFFPFTIILSGLWGMFDSLAMFFVMVALAMGSGSLRSVWGGVATLAKSIPVIYSLPLALSGKEKIRNLVIIFLIPIGVSIAVIFYFGWSLPIVTKTLYSTIPKGGESLSVWDGIYFFSSLGVLPAADIPIFSLLRLVWIPAVLAVTVVAYRWIGFGSEFAMVQTLLLCTFAFMVFRLQVNEQYAVYPLALALVDVAVWSNRRKPLLWLMLALSLFYMLINNGFLIRFLLPVYPNALNFEASALTTVGIFRDLGKFLSGTIFTATSIWYMFLILRDNRRFRIQASGTTALAGQPVRSSETRSLHSTN
jgi:hypothetical protein